MLILQENPKTFKSAGRHGCIDQDAPAVLSSDRSLVHKSQPKAPIYRLQVSHRDSSGVRLSTKSFCRRGASEMFRSTLGVSKSEAPPLLYAHGKALVAKESPGVQVLKEPRAVSHAEGGAIHRCRASMCRENPGDLFKSTKSLSSHENPGTFKSDRAVNVMQDPGAFKATPTNIQEKPDIYTSQRSLNEVQAPAVFRSPNTLSHIGTSRKFKTTRSLSMNEVGGHTWSPRTFSEFTRATPIGRPNTVYEKDTTLASNLHTTFTVSERIVVSSNPRTFSMKEESKHLGSLKTLILREKPADLGELATVRVCEEPQVNVPVQTSMRMKEKIETFQMSDTVFARVGDRTDEICRRLESMSSEQTEL